MSRRDGSDCPSGKIQYTAGGAREQRDWLRAHGDPTIRVFRCGHCGCHHLGHTDRRRERLRARMGAR